MKFLLKKSFFAIVTVFSLSLFLTLSYSEKAYACSCIQQTIEEQVTLSPFIFTGEIVEINPASDNYATGSLKATVLVIEEVRGEINSEEVFVITAGDSAQCGINIELGMQRLFFSNMTEENTFFTGLCNGGIEILANDAERAEYLNEVREISQRIGPDIAGMDPIFIPGNELPTPRNEVLEPTLYENSNEMKRRTEILAEKVISLEEEIDEANRNLERVAIIAGVSGIFSVINLGIIAFHRVENQIKERKKVE